MPQSKVNVPICKCFHKKSVKVRRKILQVAVDDAVKANEIFSTLMGDQVEPRREFIEKNALNVMNLDY